MTVGQFYNALDGYEDRIEREVKQVDQLNLILGRYVAIGVNEPSKYPTSGELTKEESSDKMSMDEFRAYAKKHYSKKGQ